MNKDSHKELWNELRKGNEEALHTLYREFYQLLFFGGLKIYRDSELVKDCINQTFLYFWEKHAGLGAAKNVSSYIFSSFKRRLLLAKESESKYSFSEEKEASVEMFFSPSHEAFLIDTQENDALKNRLMTAVNKLSKRKRQLLKLHFYEGLSYQEIAETTGLTQRTIYNKVHEAIKTLRQELAPQYSSHQLRSLIVSVFI